MVFSGGREVCRKFGKLRQSQRLIDAVGTGAVDFELL
jgi:hypothetical protein